MSYEINSDDVLGQMNSNKQGACSGALESIINSIGLQASNYADQISNIVSANINAEDITKAFEDLKAKISEEIFNVSFNLRDSQMKEVTKNKLDAYDVQDSKTSLSIPDPQVGDPDAGGHSMPPVDYSAEEDYPNTYGHIDAAKNWIKINPVLKTLELVHPSTTRIKVDGAGNVTLYTSGGMKSIHEGDVIEEVRGNKTTIVNGNMKTVVMGDVKELFNGKLETKAGDEVKVTDSTYHDGGGFIILTAGSIALN